MILVICVVIVALGLLWYWHSSGSIRSAALLAVTIAAATLAVVAVPARSDAQVSVSISVYSAPPALPAFYQPAATEANLIWQPGYWGWGSAGFFWVPGTWVEAPQIGLLWTPGYWAWNGSSYGWYPGYWGQSVGYYGGINYGYGYYGTGYQGGRWYGNTFRYNTSVTDVNTKMVHNTYVDRSAYVAANQTSRASYNGGAHGTFARPSAAQISAEHQQHYPATAAQNMHVQTAQQNRIYLAKVNHGAPAQVAVPRPLTPNNRPAGFTPVKSSDRSAQPQHVQTRPRGSPRPLDLVFWSKP